LNGTFELVRVFGIPIRVNISWFITIAFVTASLALRFYPHVFPPGSPYRHDQGLAWAMALFSGLAFFASILLHELAHSLVARRQGIPVKGITLFIFGGVSQITAEAKRPLFEFVMAIVGPLTSILLALVLLGVWWATGASISQPAGVIIEWLAIMNLVLGVFNLAPAFPMDGGRVLRSVLWGVSGNFYGSTRLATLLGRGFGFAMMALGVVTFLGFFRVFDPWSGAWFFILGTFLERSARQSWVQAVALHTLGEYHADQVMSRDLETINRRLPLGMVRERNARRRRFILFVSDEDDQVVGVVTEKEIAALSPEHRHGGTAEDAMLKTEQTAVASPRDDAANLLQRMEAEDVWHMPVVSESRVVGVVSKESLLRLIANRLVQRPSYAGSP
jgi:Zn-dependent protease/CBS domain-containing protein